MMIMKCPHCKNEFIVYRGLMREYVYRYNGYYYCSYTCWRANGGGNGEKFYRSYKYPKNEILEQERDDEIS